MRTALFVASGAALLGLMCSVFCAFAWWKVSATATKLRSMSSTLGELHEMRDYLQKIDAWSKRINSRLVMAERREAGKTEQDELPLANGKLSKAQLRRLAGIMPGQYPKHRE